MNGALDSQVSGNQWEHVPLRMLHDVLRQTNPMAVAQKDQQLFIEDLERQMADHDADFAEIITILKRLFVFTEQEEVEAFLRSNRVLTTILIDSATPFAEAFPKTPIALDVMTEEGAPRTIYALALWHGERSTAKQALNAFDERWWLANMRKAAGRIVFDYELMP
jgi:hypothetical protein